MPDAAPVTTAVRPSSENAAATSGSTTVSCAFAAASRSPEMRSTGSDLHGRVDAVPSLLELRHDLARQELEVAHHLVVREVTELHVAEQLVDAHRLVPQDLLQALLGRPDD